MDKQDGRDKELTLAKLAKNAKKGEGSNHRFHRWAQMNKGGGINHGFHGLIFQLEFKGGRTFQSAL